MYPLYSLALTLGFLLLLPRFLFDALRHGKYVAGFRQRLGFLAAANHETPIVWLHCVSVGETQAARPLARALRQQLPDYQLVVSTTTRTGQEVACQVFKDEAARVFYFPFDWRWTARRTLRAVRPTAVLIMETEIWPNFLRECRSRHVPVALINGRISNRSFRRYRLMKGFARRILADIDLAVAQSSTDAGRLRKLGFPPEKLDVSGNLKFDVGPLDAMSTLTEDFRRRFDLGPNAPLILAASTHAPEERIILECLRQIRSESATKPRLMIGPRHPERFAEVASLLKLSGFTWVRRTDPRADVDPQVDVILLDTIGELLSAYPLASIVFVGGSIANNGGHNILEPAAAGRCIVTGANTDNFEAIVRAFVEAQAIIQLPTLSANEAASDLARVLTDLNADQVLREELGRRAAALVESNRGATERTMKVILPLLVSRSSLKEETVGRQSPEI